MTQTATPPQDTVTYWRDRAFKAEQERDDFKQRFYTILDEKRWEKKWDAIPSSTKLQRIDKDLIKQLVHTDKYGQHHDPKGRVRVNFTTYAKNLGVSDDTIARRFERLTTSNLIEDAKLVEEPDGPRWYVHINKKLIQEADHEKISFPEDTPKQGGDRYTCQKCGSKHVKIKRTIKRTLICLNPTCKHEVALDDITDEYTLPPKHTERAQDAEDVKATCFLPPESNLQDTRNPDTPPQVAPIALDPIELERQAGQLLLGIAAGPSHIEMNTDPAKGKYSTIDRPLTLTNAYMHLRGRCTKGAVNRPLEGEIRGNCFDGDNPEEWHICTDAAARLEEHGYKPLLLPSPSQGKHKGGGLLWIIYDQNVDAYSALQTIYHYAPDLKKLKQFWPGGGINIRLPGGKYRCPDFEAWITVLDENGEVLSRDGQNLAAALLDRQTPASVVVPHQKPAPEVTKPPIGQGGYLDKDFAKQYIAEFNAMRDWSDIVAMAGGFDRGHFLAIWRGDRTPNVAINSKTDLAKDFARPDEPAMDKYDVWCRIMAHRTGEDWRLFKKHDLEQRCAYRRSQQERKAS